MLSAKQFCATWQFSTIADTWVHLTNISQAGERNRVLSIVKSCSMKHSNQVRELILERSRGHPGRCLHGCRPLPFGRSSETWPRKQKCCLPRGCSNGPRETLKPESEILVSCADRIVGFEWRETVRPPTARLCETSPRR